MITFHPEIPPFIIGGLHYSKNAARITPKTIGFCLNDGSAYNAKDGITIRRHNGECLRIPEYAGLRCSYTKDGELKDFYSLS